MASTPGQPKPKKKQADIAEKRYLTVPFCTPEELGPMPLEMDGVKGRRLKFCYMFLQSLNAEDAYREAGFTVKNDLVARVMGSKFLKNPKIAAVIQKLWWGRLNKEKLTPDFVLGKLKEIVHKAMQDIPVTDKEGNPTGVYTFQGAVANNALKLLGEHLGIFQNKYLAQVFNINNNVTLAPEGAVVITKEQLAGMPSGLLDQLHTYLATPNGSSVPALPAPNQPIIVEAGPTHVIAG